MAEYTSLLAKTIKLKDLGLDAKAARAILADNKDKPVKAARVLALVTDIVEKPIKDDPSKMGVRYIGQFEITNIVTGEVMKSTEAFLPSACDRIIKSMRKAQKEGGAVIVCMDLIISGTDKTPVGYQWDAEVAVQRDSDPFQVFRGLALPAPKKK